jgi:iron complex outermembrane receptor protein
MDKSADGFDSKYALDYLKHKFIVSIDYQLTKSLSASWVGSYLVRAGNYTVPTSTSVQNYQPYFLLNARILCSKKNYDVFCDVNNLLDTNYADYGGLTQPGINFNVGIRLKL